MASAYFLHLLKPLEEKPTQDVILNNHNVLTIIMNKLLKEGISQNILPNFDI